MGQIVATIFKWIVVPATCGIVSYSLSQSTVLAAISTIGALIYFKVVYPKLANKKKDSR